jgi:hypothetical protein
MIDQLTILAGIPPRSGCSCMDPVDLAGSKEIMNRLYRQVEQAAGMFHSDKILHLSNS